MLAEEMSYTSLARYAVHTLFLELASKTSPVQSEQCQVLHLKVSHAIRLMQQTTKRLEIYTNTIDEMLKIKLPKPKKQTDLMIR